MKGKNQAIGYVFTWNVGGEVTDARIESACPMCGVAAIVKLPPALLDAQPDDTTHVCHPMFGGCNHGFAMLDRLRCTD